MKKWIAKITTFCLKFNTKPGDLKDRPNGDKHFEEKTKRERKEFSGRGCGVLSRENSKKRVVEGRDNRLEQEESGKHACDLA